MTSSEALILLWAGGAILTVSIAMERNRNPAIWLIAALPLGPFTCGLLLMLPRGERDPAVGLRPLSMDLCPSCFEPIQKDASACRYCGKAEPFSAI